MTEIATLNASQQGRSLDGTLAFLKKFTEDKFKHWEPLSPEQQNLFQVMKLVVDDEFWRSLSLEEFARGCKVKKDSELRDLSELQKLLREKGKLN